MALSTIEMYAGTAMLGEGVRAALHYMGIDYRTVCYVEREAYAASVLVARMEEGSLDEAPIWSDASTFDAAAWYHKVSGIVAGFPCQDISIAGNRAGLDGERSGQFFEVLRVASDSGAWWMLLENVAAIASATASAVDEAEGDVLERAASRVVGELADLGWNAEWITLSASDVGASHGRARWFCFAWRVGALGYAGHHAGNAKQREQPESTAGRIGKSGQDRDELGDSGLQHCDLQQREIRPQYSTAGQKLGDAASIGRKTGSRNNGTKAEMVHESEFKLRAIDRRSTMADAQCSERRPHTGSGICSEQGNDPRWEAASRIGNGSTALADAGSEGWQGREFRRTRNDDGGRPETYGSTCQLRGLFAPGPNDPRWPAVLESSPELAPALEPAFRSVVNGLAFNMGNSRAQRLKCVGNGVVALCAAVAFIVLAQRSELFKKMRLTNDSRTATTI